jgi:ATP-binding cassette, subfamily C (CFTR/MRP), member 1
MLWRSSEFRLLFVLVKIHNGFHSPNSLWLALFRAYGAQYGLAAILKLFQDVLAYAQPQLLRWLLSFIAEYQRKRYAEAGEKPPVFQGFLIAILMFVAGVAQSVILHQVRL